MDAKSPRTIGSSPVSLMLDVEDVDAWFAQAIEAGGQILREVVDHDQGDRMGGLEDPFGYCWWIASRIR